MDRAGGRSCASRPGVSRKAIDERAREHSLMLTREERRAENEAIFRAGNEAIVRNLDAPEGALPLICECDSAECFGRIHVTVEEYEAVRSSAAHFVLESGHEDEDERVVDVFERYVVVEKTGAGRRVVEEAF